MIRNNNSNNNKYYSMIQFRSQSQEAFVHKSNHRRSNSSQSAADLFTLVIPSNNGSSVSPLLCPICSLPMMKPTLLPCQHTFCYKCLQNLHNSSIPNDNQIKLITCPKCSVSHRINSLENLEQNHSIQLLINTLLCETCQQINPSNQLDTCFYCFSVHCPKCYDQHVENHKTDMITNRNLYRITSADEIRPSSIIENNQIIENKPILRLKSFNIEKQSTTQSNKQNIDTEQTEDENSDPSQPVNPKKKSNYLRKLIKSSRHRHSTPTCTKESISTIKKTSSAKLPNRPTIIIDIDIDDKSKTETTPLIVPVTPVRKFMSFNEQYMHTAEYITQCKQRQSELNRSVKKLIEVLTKKTTETINQISDYWMHLKQLALDQFQSKTPRFQLFNYLLKNCCSILDSRKHLESYFEQNDEIKAALQVLLTTLLIVDDQQTPLTISQSFDREEQTTLGRLRRHLELLLASYSDELSFIVERQNVYESRFAAWKNWNATDLDSISYEWSQIIEHDYPSLVEKISNDFITKTPQTEKVLLEMMKNTKKRLLNMENQGTNQRTSVVSL
ncbi:unnamed protein product [Adineta steineri]|uniref:RING-type domain-containing protein n=1 Tax=Adineta steineri TaxID=433720 RepID=A0A813Q1E1_9BILA|nr:unnamed protein product [Adineta steineri]